MNKRTKIIRNLSVVVMGLTGVLTAWSATTTVRISDFVYVPSSVTIAAGDTVTWINDDSMIHTATSDTGSWDSGSLTSGASFSHTFDTPGTYPYHCTPHPFMTGEVIVESVSIENPIAERIPPGDIVIELETVLDGLVSPLGMAMPDDGSGRIFVYEQNGLVWVLTSEGMRLSEPLLDLHDRLVVLGAYDERGLLGFAVHPNFPEQPLVYTYTSEPSNGPADFPTALPVGATNNHQSVLAEWRIDNADGNRVDPATRREVLRMDQPQSNHNGGAMRFGPDGYLYLALGDGGAANDLADGHVPGGNGQSLETILGTVIRIDVNGSNAANGQYGIPADNPFVGVDGHDEIFAYGFRNPFSFSFDRLTGDLYLGDVGQGQIEEVDVVTAGGNYGWNLKEGTFWFDPSTGELVTAPVRPGPPGLIDPIAEYDHDDGTVVMGGFVYRGTAIPELSGRYVFGDWGTFGAPSGRLFYLDEANAIKELQIGPDDRPLGLWIKGLGEGLDGTLYVFGSRVLGASGATGKMIRIVPAPPPVLLAVSSVDDEAGLSSSWTGGRGPYVLQERSDLSDKTWRNVAFSTGSDLTLVADTQRGFQRVADLARHPRIPFSAHLSRADSVARGTGAFVLEGNALTFELQYGGLSGPATLAHIHGPATTSESAGVLINLEPYHVGSFGMQGVFSGLTMLTDSQRVILLQGQSYVNIHTAANPGGEIRGQIAPVTMQVELDGASNPAASGLGTLTLVRDELTLNLTYRGLSGIATMAHIHGPAAPGEDALVLVDLAPVNGGAYGDSGRLFGTITLTPAQLGHVIDGLTYVNFHTPQNPGGELRGQIRPQTTAVPLTAWLNGAAEAPDPVETDAIGSGTFTLEGSTLVFNVAYGGLSGPATAAHIHGPAPVGQATGVLIDLAPYHEGEFGTAGAFSGVIELTLDQRDLVLGGQTYVNIHTAAHSPGEIRGQIVPVLMTAALSGSNERNTPAATPASGSGIFLLVRDRLTMNLTYRDLLSPATATHIHGPASVFQNADVLVSLAPFAAGDLAESGGLTGTVELTAAQFLDVIRGATYVNFHTSIFPSGEIRGQILR